MSAKPDSDPRLKKVTFGSIKIILLFECTFFIFQKTFKNGGI